jgi:hypothetical protein
MIQHYFIPEWITLLFAVAILAPPFFLANLGAKGASEASKSSIYYTILGFYTLYYMYVFVAYALGCFSKVNFPPTVLLYTTFPMGIFLFLILFKNKTFQTIFNNLKIEDIIQVHLFRLIGMFFILLGVFDTLPRFFAFVAGFGDVLTAITSIFIVILWKNKAKNAKRMTFIWNTFGFVDIMFTAIAANVLTKLSIDNGTMGVDTLARFPFCLIPAFAPPTIIFLHYLIYLKLKKE